jgi:hypothetical protein
MSIETIKREVRGIVLALLLVAATTLVAHLLVQYPVAQRAHFKAKRQL